ISANVFCNFASYHATAACEAAGCGMVSETSQPLIKRQAFQILLVNAFPWLHNSSSNKISLPAEADNNNPQRTPSAPNFSIKSNGSGEFPNDFDIFLRWASRTIPVKYTFENGFSPAYS